MAHVQSHFLSRSALFLALCGALLALPGCVVREIHIASNPSGALVLLNDQEIGRTPISVPFTWHGDYDVRLRYEVNQGSAENPRIVRYYLHTHKKTTTPWFETIPLDLMAELLPIPFKDEQFWAFNLPPITEPTDVELIDRATELKSQLNPAPSAP